jgi:hypothetical protein
VNRLFSYSLDNNTLIESCRGNIEQYSDLLRQSGITVNDTPLPESVPPAVILNVKIAVLQEVE